MRVKVFSLFLHMTAGSGCTVGINTYVDVDDVIL